MVPKANTMIITSITIAIIVAVMTVMSIIIDYLANPDNKSPITI